MTWTEPATWYANLPSFYAAAAAFITDPAGNVLLIKPTYRDHWAFPGGYVDEGEYPHDACARELREELGVAMAVGRLLVVDWAPPAGQRPRAIVSFTFDCGFLTRLDDLGLQEHELESIGFFCARESRAASPGERGSKSPRGDARPSPACSGIPRRGHHYPANLAVRY